MQTQNIKNQANNLAEQAKSLVNEGNQRQLVLETKEGKTLIQAKVTTAVAVALFLLITGFVSIPLIIVAGVVGMLLGVKAEVRHLA